VTSSTQAVLCVSNTRGKKKNHKKKPSGPFPVLSRCVQLADLSKKHDRPRDLTPEERFDALHEFSEERKKEENLAASLQEKKSWPGLAPTAPCLPRSRKKKKRKEKSTFSDSPGERGKTRHLAGREQPPSAYSWSKKKGKGGKRKGPSTAMSEGGGKKRGDDHLQAPKACALAS